jgi:hypothetical protein
MKQRAGLMGLWLLVVLLSLSSPSEAAEFSNADLEGTWNLHAFGNYDVKGFIYYGVIRLDSEGMIIDSAGGAISHCKADYTDGGFSCQPSGQIAGLIEGSSLEWGPFTIAVKLGWMDLSKNQITFIGADNNECQLLVTLVRAD